MKQIALDGIVGYEVMARDIRTALESAAGDEIELIVNSPGGSVTEGIAIYNALRDYRRKGGKITARVVGMAASMATYIPMAADTIEIEDNAVWMIHNPWSFALGDQNDMRHEADILDGLAGILSAAYEKKTGKTREEMRSMMDAETWLYGGDIVAQGFADSVVLAAYGPEKKEEALALAHQRVREAKDKLKEDPQEKDLTQLAAMVRAQAGGNKPVVNREIPAAKAEEIKEGAMDISALKTEHPDVFAEAVKIGVTKERERVNELNSYVEADPDNTKLAEVVSEAITTGKSSAEINAKLQVAIRDGRKFDGENPPEVQGSAGPDEDELVASLKAAVIKGVR